MLRWALLFLVVAATASLPGYYGVASGALAIAQFLLILFVALLVITVVVTWAQRRGSVRWSPAESAGTARHRPRSVYLKSRNGAYARQTGQPGLPRWSTRIRAYAEEKPERPIEPPKPDAPTIKPPKPSEPPVKEPPRPTEPPPAPEQPPTKPPTEPPSPGIT
jgi:uncharacterized membrane protein YtjA (UPF0391 family)